MHGTDTAASPPRKRSNLAGGAGHASEPWAADAVVGLDALARATDRPVDAATRAAADTFAPRTTRAFLDLIAPGAPGDDPLLRQIWPQADENVSHHGYHADPLDEAGCEPVPGLLHKYHGRALILTTGPCALRCRFCFRRHRPEAVLTAADWRRIVDYLDGHAEVDEVILSGGDPLGLADQTLAGMVEELALIGHLRRLRLHTRYPVAAPERVGAALVDALHRFAGPTVVVLHVNHPREWSPGLRAAVARLRRGDVQVLTQSVLLAGVNDHPAVLAELYTIGGELGALPYYLHQLDPVQGAAHFAVDDRRARALHRTLHARLPGYLVPRLVREVPGDPGKRSLVTG